MFLRLPQVKQVPGMAQPPSSEISGIDANAEDELSEGSTKL